MPKSLFEILCDKLKQAREKYNSDIPWYIMTSKENHVFEEGEFTLASGKKSNYYVNMKKAITNPEILSTIAKLITDKIKEEGIDKVAGPALGDCFSL